MKKLKQLRAVKINTNELQLKEFNGKTWLTGPTVMAKQTVMNDIFYSRDALQKSVPSWNGRPVVLNHPQVDGKYVSANAPEILDKSGVGMLFGCSVDDETKLRGEVWLDVSRLELFPEVTAAIASGKKLEVSTGLLLDAEEKEGSYNGKDYSIVAHNIAPDHLALLPGDTGAFSVADGAGFPRVNRMMQANIVEYWSKRQLLIKAITAAKLFSESFYIEEVHEEFIIVYWDNTYYQIHYTIDETNGKTDLKKPVAVFLKVEYIPIQEGDDMTKPNTNTKAKDPDVATNAEGTPAAVPVVEPVATNAEAAPAKGAEVGPRQAEMEAVYNRHREKLVSVIVANKDANFTEAELDGMPVSMLERLEALCTPKPPVDHKGLGGPGGLAANETKTETPYIGV